MRRGWGQVGEETAEEQQGKSTDRESLVSFKNFDFHSEEDGDHLEDVHRALDMS